MKKTLIGLILLVIVFSTNIFAANEDDLNTFRNSLRTGNIQLFKSSLHPKGLLLARSYNESNRKQEFIVQTSDIPASFQISVQRDIPFDLRYLFGGTIRNRSIEFIKEEASCPHLNENAPSTIRPFAISVISFANDHTRSFTPTAFVTRGGNLVLVEGEINGNMVSGSIAVFIKTGNQVFLRWVIDLK